MNDSVKICLNSGSYEAGIDTFRLNKGMKLIFKFPEVDAINTQIDRRSNGAHGVSMTVHDEFNGDTSYYRCAVGDNSLEDRYVNFFNFLLDKKTNEIKVYEPALDTVFQLTVLAKDEKVKFCCVGNTYNSSLH